MPNPTDMSCATCVKRHETGNPAAPLQCRALPPAASVGLWAAYPLVRPDDYCHTHYQRASTAFVQGGASTSFEDVFPEAKPKRGRRTAAAEEPKLL